MWHCWMHFILAWISMATPTLCQSGDWGSGFDIYSETAATNDTSQAVGDEPVRMRNNQDWITSAASSPSPSPTLLYEPQPDKCFVHFSTNAASARRLKAQKEELAYLQAIQHGNKAVMESLEQFVGAELGDLSYEDVIKENILGIHEDQKNCHEVVEKAEEDLEKQLEGEVSGVIAGMQKIRQESLAFEDMLRTAADIANRLEISSQVLHASFTKQLKDIAKIHR
ncbi:uncharacterized protein si:ch211-142k18.1 [Micropterus salmoides]|uniref:uncharacterized protein si:ch211-142k18.1 n=1 Tax=Micropterus salmoides TaxID=27706 RepID=UPI0018EBF001|nr:uncharacterized protein si:ch211-142k18.1 [Micropterus salmoides]XP_038583785.1 uncharacterized protein si:ch211-142k18.1 [Micropterus salmoides]